MEKEKISLKKSEVISFEFGKMDIKVEPYLSMMQKTVLIKSYLESYFGEGDFVENYMIAENGNILGILDLCTNIDVQDISLDNVVSSGLWYKIRDNILNYSEFTGDLWKVVDKIKKQNELEKSIGNSFDRMSNAVIQFLSKVSELDLSNEGINKLVGELKNTTNKYEEKFDSKKVILPIPEKKVRKPRTKKVKE
jgi:hypothetical protein